MGHKYINIAGQKYIFKRYVSEKEMNVFKKHLFAKSYLFRTKGQQIAFYVKNTSTSSSFAMSKYHKRYTDRIFRQ